MLRSGIPESYGTSILFQEISISFSLENGQGNIPTKLVRVPLPPNPLVASKYFIISPLVHMREYIRTHKIQ